MDGEDFAIYTTSTKHYGLSHNGVFLSNKMDTIILRVPRCQGLKEWQQYTLIQSDLLWSRSPWQYPEHCLWHGPTSCSLSSLRDRELRNV